MKAKLKTASLAFIALAQVSTIGYAASRPEETFPVFQFPQNEIPRIDGDFSDWDLVPESYAIGLDQLQDTELGKGANLDPADFDLSVKVAWVAGFNRLYFLYEATDDYWDFARSGLKNDIFEIAVDGDLSGGPFIKSENQNKNRFSKSERHFMGHGSHAQNYHVFTPASQKAWAMVWGNTPWIKDFPFANAASDYSFKHGESGTLRMEFYITLFDHADRRGPAFSTESQLLEDKLIGLSWCILEYDNEEGSFHSFMNLAHDTEMIRNASSLCVFRLMPIQDSLLPDIEAKWSFSQDTINQRRFAFFDHSHGDIKSWRWDFGDGSSSDLQHPVHQYNESREWTVTLTVKSESTEDSLSKVWDVVSP